MFQQVPSGLQWEQHSNQSLTPKVITSTLVLPRPYKLLVKPSFIPALVRRLQYFGPCLPLTLANYPGFFFMVMSLLTFFYVVASLRTNVVFFLVFLFIDLAFLMLTACYWTLAQGMTVLGNNLQIVGAPFSFAVRFERITQDHFLEMTKPHDSIWSLRHSSSGHI
jgi:hypothetical protein